jgi:hypothetical protein
LPAARTLLVVRRTGTCLKSEEPELAYYISSLPGLPNNTQRFANLVRDHWGACEIRNHWVRDAQLGEDKTRIKNHQLNANLASLRVAVLAIKAHLLPDASWPEVIESAQASTSFAYQLAINHRVK